ncbi:MAG: class I SAM-dependent methyltransferase [Halanaerobiaceae bacterium]
MSGDFMQGVEFSHALLRRHIDRGAYVIDATAGNGYDTLFLSGLVGKKGKIWALDIQKEAIANTQRLLKKNRAAEQVQLINGDHQHLLDYVNIKVDGILFNLGYLPGGNKKIITKKETTLKALRDGLDILKSAGIIVLVVYTGHSGGQEELKSLLNFSEQLDAGTYNVIHYHFLNQDTPPPQVIGIIKR